MHALVREMCFLIVYVLLNKQIGEQTVLIIWIIYQDICQKGVSSICYSYTQNAYSAHVQ